MVAYRQGTVLEFLYESAFSFSSSTDSDIFYIWLVLYSFSLGSSLICFCNPAITNALLFHKAAVFVLDIRCYRQDFNICSQLLGLVVTSI